MAPPFKLEEARQLLLNKLDTLIKNVANIHMEFCDFACQYAENSKPSTSYISKADLRAKEERKAEEYAKTFKSLLQTTNNAEFMKELLWCYSHWNENIMPLMKKKTGEAFLDIPAQMAGLFFLYGDKYKAMCCLKNILIIQPHNYEARHLLLKWSIYLAEIEVAEKQFSHEKKMNKKYKLVASLQDHLDSLLRISTAYVKFYRTSDPEKSMDLISNELKKFTERHENTFVSAELQALMHFMHSHFGKLPEAPDSTPDVLYSCFNWFLKCDQIVKNRIRGLFGDNTRVDFTTIFKDPFLGLEVLSSLAEWSDCVRDNAVEHFNLGLTREAFSYAEIGLRTAYKTASFPRALEFTNLAMMVAPEISTDSAMISTAVATNRIYILTTAARSAPKSPGRCASPGRIVSNVAQKLLESFEELTITDNGPLKRLHHVMCRTPCDVCTMYNSCPVFAINYHMSMLIFHGYNELTMSQMQQQFLKIRERVIPLQQKLMDGKQRPRPPLWVCEVFALCAVRWLRHSDLTTTRDHLLDTRKQDLRTNIIETAMKVVGYSSMRLVCYFLSLRQIKRQDALGNSETMGYSWMQNSSEKEGTKAPATPKNAVERAVAEATREFGHYNHLLYRDWRFPICTFIARLSPDPWLSALMWNESTVLSTRQQIRVVSGKLDKVAFSRSGSLQTALKLLPPDYSVVQITSDAAGNLWLMKLYSERDPVMIPLTPKKKVEKVRTRMVAVLKANDASGCVKDGDVSPNQFWLKRREVDKQLKQIVISVELYLFKSLAPLLLPSHSLTSRGRKLAEDLVKTIDQESFTQALAEELVSVVNHISKPKAWNDLIASVGEFCGLEQEKTESLQNAFIALKKRVDQVGVINKYSTMFTFLYIAPILACVPFEFMNVYRERPHVARIVSVHALLKQITKASSLPRRVDVENSYYILDPDNSLTATQKRMTEFLEELHLDGLVGKAPTPANLKSILESKDMFFYLGHGSGSKHMSKRVIKESSCNAVSVLMGCSSVNLDYDGWGLDGKCTVYDYTIALCPAVVGCLWMVTDGEIDRYFMTLVQSCFSTDANTTMTGGKPRLRNLMDAMRKAREQSKLPYLTGAAVVCFGLPVTSAE